MSWIIVSTSVVWLVEHISSLCEECTKLWEFSIGWCRCEVLSMPHLFSLSFWKCKVLLCSPCITRTVLQWLAVDNTHLFLIYCCKTRESLKVKLLTSPNGWHSSHQWCCQVYCCILIFPHVVLCATQIKSSDMTCIQYFYTEIKKKRRI
jgi:hypothetical protein